MAQLHIDRTLFVMKAPVFSMFRAALLALLASHTVRASSSSGISESHVAAVDVCSANGDSPNGVCKESDQNVLIQGKMQVFKSEEDVPAGPGLMPTPFEIPTGPALIPTPIRHTPVAELPETPMEKFAMAPGFALKHFSDHVGAPNGLILVPAVASFFILLMQCTDVHPDSYSMEEEDDTARPPVRADRLPLFDIARFGLLVGVIWTQLLLAFGDDIVASILHEFVWPTWFLLAGIFGSSLAYESVMRVICYSITTNALLILIGVMFAFFNYQAQPVPVSTFFGGAWVLWCLLLYRLAVSPLFHMARAFRLPVVFLLVLIHFGSYSARLRMPATDAVVDLHPHQVEHLLLMVKSMDATFYSALLNAPYFAAGLLMSPIHWNDLLATMWFRCFAAANAIGWFVLTATPLLCSLGHWHCVERPWGIKLLIHADTLSGYGEDVACYFTRMSAVLFILCVLSVFASSLRRWSPKLASYLEGCGSRIRYTLALFVLWYMIRPCILSPPKLPFQRSWGMSDFAMGGPALFLALVLTSSGIRQLFRWIVEPYWAKCWLEGCYSNLVEQMQEVKAMRGAYVTADPWPHH